MVPNTNIDPRKRTYEDLERMIHDDGGMDHSTASSH